VIGKGRHNTGEIVRTSRWADDVCSTTGAWEGELEGIRDELGKSNFAARPSDGGSGDSVEGTISVREAVDCAIRATTDTLQERLKRARAASRHPTRSPRDFHARRWCGRCAPSTGAAAAAVTTRTVPTQPPTP